MPLCIACGEDVGKHLAMEYIRISYITFERDHQHPTLLISHTSNELEVDTEGMNFVIGDKEYHEVNIASYKALKSILIGAYPEGDVDFSKGDKGSPALVSSRHAYAFQIMHGNHAVLSFGCRDTAGSKKVLVELLRASSEFEGNDKLNESLRLIISQLEVSRPIQGVEAEDDFDWSKFEQTLTADPQNK